MLLAFAGLLSVYSVQAQNAETKKQEQTHLGKHGRAKTDTERMKADRMRIKQAIDTIRKDTTLSDLQKKERIRELTEHEKREIRGGLSPRPNRKMKEYERGNRPNKAQVWQGLELTDTQKTKMREIREKYRTQQKALAESSEPNEQKAEKLKAIREKQRAEMNALLTQEQREKLKNSQPHK